MTTPSRIPARRVEEGTTKLGCLIAPIANDVRDVIVEDPSGLLAVAPRWIRPRLEPSRRRLKDAFRNYCKQRRGGEWIDFPADGHPEEDVIDVRSAAGSATRSRTAA